eukprot:GEMP01004357.1.p1 GENE.GEMP01004357.1~~GEMP01004357.1.p1  ORF type:complete len:1303 (+),score=263.96 GEMP01004357.1:214-4122(+)
MGFTFHIGELEVFFPYDTIYPEQFQYMKHLKQALDAKGHAVLEMPTGTGKTASLFSLITAYQYYHPKTTGKLIYCTRTIPEMNKALEELRLIIQFRQKVLTERGENGEDANILGIGYSARRNMCVHDTVRKEQDRDKVDSMCHKLTASWVRKSKDNLCNFYEKFNDIKEKGQEEFLPRGIYTLDELQELGKEKGWCPYYTCRKLIEKANVVVLNYQYVIDPKVSASANLGSRTSFLPHKQQVKLANEEKEPSIVVFDEAHNIDDVCLEAFTVEIYRHTLDSAMGNVTKLGQEIEKVKKEDASKLEDEYKRLVEGLQQSGKISTDVMERLHSPVFDDFSAEAVPGSIRRAENFLDVLRRLVVYLKSYIRVKKNKAVAQGPSSFLLELQEAKNVDARSLKFCYERLRSLLTTLQLQDLEEFAPLGKVCDFCTLLGTYTQGFTLITDPFPEAPGLYDPVVLLSCMDASIAMESVMKRYQSIVLTSATISPLEMYPKILGMSNVVCTESFSMTLDRKRICPLIVTKGPDQVLISSAFEKRDELTVMKNYGELTEQLCQVVPDGIVGFFTSYRYMELVIENWYETGMMSRILQHKLVFIETKDVVATTYALSLYRQACDSGRGALFLSVARGKVSEGIDFDRHYGRCVVLFGVPFQYTLSHELRSRLLFLQKTYSIKEAEFLNFDAMRAASQCVGRIIRSKKDYGIMVFADHRYARHDKRAKIPDWIQQFIEDGNNLSTDVAVGNARQFLLQMAQPVPEESVNLTVVSGALLSEQTAHGELDPPCILTHQQVTAKFLPPKQGLTDFPINGGSVPPPGTFDGAVPSFPSTLAQGSTASLAQKGGMDPASFAQKGGTDPALLAQKGGIGPALLAQKGGMDPASLAQKGGMDPRMMPYWTQKGDPRMQAWLAAQKGDPRMHAWLAQKGKMDPALLAQKGKIDPALLAQKGKMDSVLLAQKGKIDPALLAQKGKMDLALLAQKGKIDPALLAQKGKMDPALLARKGDPRFASGHTVALGKIGTATTGVTAASLPSEAPVATGAGATESSSKSALPQSRAGEAEFGAPGRSANAAQAACSREARIASENVVSYSDDSDSDAVLVAKPVTPQHLRAPSVSRRVVDLATPSSPAAPGVPLCALAPGVREVTSHARFIPPTAPPATQRDPPSSSIARYTERATPPVSDPGSQSGRQRSSKVALASTVAFRDTSSPSAIPDTAAAHTGARAKHSSPSRPLSTPAAPKVRIRSRKLAAVPSPSIADAAQPCVTAKAKAPGGKRATSPKNRSAPKTGATKRESAAQPDSTAPKRPRKK